MIGNQQQKDDGYVNVGTKVPPHVAELLNIIAASKGTDIYGLLQLFIQTIIRAAKCETALPPHLKLLMDMIGLDRDWNRAFSFASPSAQTDVAQIIMVLQRLGPLAILYHSTEVGVVAQLRQLVAVGIL